MNDPHIILPSARLVADPEQKQTKNGTPYLLIRVAANGSHKDKQTQQWVDHDTMFATIFEYDQRLAATYLQELHKGTPVRVEGDLKWSAGTDRNGQPRTDFTINYATITMVLKKAKAQQSTPQHPTPQQQAANWGNTNQPDPYAQFSAVDEW
jgi:single-strand DNA-binding protein|uniref:Single-stranded DNA-binding protein n=1 Tax=Myoviridae sp. ctCpP1 TaxID=2825054 RepID=A0A8S5V7J8_9CAUD|nr:MAG TPA: Single stranded DNA binding protein [Myoviridae sp. ctCpP1]